MILQATRYQFDAGVGVITLARPDRRNAWNGQMHMEYRWLLSEADNDPAVRVIVVTGDQAGSAFCAGADLSLLETFSQTGAYDPGTDDSIASPGFGVDAHFDASYAYHFGVGKPVIAAINGPAAGVGFVLAAFADLRFCAEGAKFTAAHGRFNLPAEYGLSWILPRIVGLTHANDILLSSRLFDAEEAYRMGFLNRVLPADQLMGAVLSYAKALAVGVSPRSARETKRQIYRDLHQSAASSVHAAERLLEEMVGDPDYKEGIKAWMEKRAADWKG